MVVFPTGQPNQRRIQHNRYLTRLPGHNNTDQLCDRESQLTNLPESWPHKELLYNRPVLINQGYKIIPATHKEVYLLSRPLKAMAHRYRHTEKEAHLLSGPSELQPPDASEAQKPNTCPTIKTGIQPIDRKPKS